jgi:hypothetical protein
MVMNIQVPQNDVYLDKLRTNASSKALASWGYAGK